MKGKELFNKYENVEFKDEIKEILDKYVKEEKRYIWDVETDNTIYDLESNGFINETVWDNNHGACFYFDKHNNTYTNREDAEYEKIKRAYERKLREATTKAWEEFGEEINWEDSEQKKFFVSCIISTNILQALFNCIYRVLPHYYYFPTKKSAQKFIEENRELIKEFFEVEEV